MSNPCISVFLPFTMETAIPQKVSQGSARYSDDSLWWKLERLSYELEEDYPRNTALWNTCKGKGCRSTICSLRTEKGWTTAFSVRWLPGWKKQRMKCILCCVTPMPPAASPRERQR